MRPDAIVLGLGVNGLNLARSLARRRVTVHGVSFHADEVGRWSRCCRLIDASDSEWDESTFVDWLAGFAKTLGNRPAVFPTGDLLALWLARNRSRLGPHLRMWGTEGDVLASLLCKERLAGSAAAAGLLTPPALTNPIPEVLRAWCRANAGPYLVKPRCVDADDDPRGAPISRAFDDEAELMEHVERVGGDGLIVQRLLRGGDDWQFVVAGLCDRKGRIVTMGTMRKIVQHPHDSGTAAYAVVPAYVERDAEVPLFAAARALLDKLKYEGLFGFEFFKDRESGKLCLLDFDPRSLDATFHYVASGLDLPYLSYRLLRGDDLRTHPLTPVLRRAHGADFWGCLGAWRRRRGTGRLGVGRLLGMLLRARARPVWNWRDPLPALRHGLRKVRGLFDKTRPAPARRALDRPIVKV